MANTLKFGNGEWYGKKDTILAYNDLNSNYKPLPFNFSRASSATVINKDGLIETVGSGQPRIDYKDDSEGALLLEPSRTNLITYSEPISSETGADGITYESFNWNLGFTNCIKFGDNSQTRYRYFTGTIANSTEYVISAFVIMDDLSEPVLGTASNNGDLILRVGGTTATTGNLPNVNMGNNIYRVSSVITSDVGGGTTGLLKYRYQSNKGFRIVGFQLEEGSYATSYIPTQGSAVTRLADSCNNGGNEQVINSTEGTLYLETATLLNTQTTDNSITLTDGGNNKIIFRYRNTNAFNVKVFVNGVAQAEANHTLSNATDFNKIAVKWKLNDYEIYVNGISVFTDSNALVFPNNSLNTLDLADGTSFPLFGKVKDLKVYNTALTDAELKALTT